MLARLRAITGESVGRINQCLTAYEPVMEAVLFLNDHEEVAGRLRQMLSEIPALGASLKLFELADDQQVDSRSEQEEITSEMLSNILDASEERKRHQQDMWDKYGHT